MSFPDTTVGAGSGRLQPAQVVMWVALVAAVFALGHPYTGVRHDGVLYLGQALARLLPEVYSNDVYFRWGSQDRYTLFSPVYAALVGRLGVGAASMLLVVIAQAMFLAASYAVVRRALPGGQRGFAMLFLAVSVGLYGGQAILRMAEPFVTPRPFVEAVTLGAIALALGGRPVGAWLLLGAGALLHPLMALTGMLFVWIYLVLEDRRWLWMALLAAVPVLAGLAGVPPFDQIHQRFDTQWLHWISEDNLQLFLASWTHYDYGFVLCDIVLLWIATQVTAGTLQRLAWAALLAAAASLTLSFIGADLLHNVFMTNVQLWRTIWVVHWVAVAALVAIVAGLWRESEIGKVIAGMALFVFVLRGLPTATLAGIVALVFSIARHRIVISRGLAHLILLGLAGGAIANWGANAYRAYLTTALEYVDPVRGFLVTALTKPQVLLLIAVALLWVGLVRERARLSALLALCLLAGSAMVWDRRTPLMAYTESEGVGAHPFSRIVKPDQQVLWQDNLQALWILMQRPSYAALWQASGQMFHRDTAAVLQSRYQKTKILYFQEIICDVLNNVSMRDNSCTVNEDTLADTCRSAPDLDYVVLKSDLPGKWASSWTPPVEVGGLRSHYYLYACSRFRA